MSTISRRAELSNAISKLERMIEIRLVEERVQGLYNDGFVRGSTHLSIGQEAVCVGIAAATRPSDIVTCTYRGHGVALSLGITPEGVLGEICGRVIGCTGGLGGSMHMGDIEVGLFPTFAIVGAGLPVAAGAALTAQYKGTDGVAIAILGDGATNIGAFHETLNMAAIWKLPLVVIIENNLYGEYTRINLSTPFEDLAHRADAYGIYNEIVDGQVVADVEQAVSNAVARCRAGDGPVVLEMKTYRFSGHSRADPATYRPAGELDTWKKRDPIDLYADLMIKNKVISADQLLEMKANIKSRVEAAVETVLNSPSPEHIEMFSHISAT
jgi:TPP-dependent pyruvate/acetoin dehydrogenase alpha subunit